MVIVNYQLSTINRSRAGTLALQLSTINSQLSTLNSQLSTINYQLSTKFSKAAATTRW
ncbi:MAG: hypothetical protein ACRC62_00115 [Microcoleus sp.]